MKSIKINKGQNQRIKFGYPWIYSNQVDNSESQNIQSIQSGGLVKILNSFGNYEATGYYNRHSLISCRILTKKENQEINQEFFIKKLEQALQLRKNLFTTPYYRLVHSEADGLPGLIIDRFDNILVLQISTFGIENLLQSIINALNLIFLDPVIILKNDIEARKLEGLNCETKIIQGEIKEQNILIENDLRFYFDPIGGQKTGWFFDQRLNRQFIAAISKEKDVLDCYCYNGGFGINSANSGAKSVTFIDSSEIAIENVKKNLRLNNLQGNFEYINGKVFDELEKLIKIGKKFEVITLDPPAFIKSKKDFFAGIKGYEKLTKIASGLLTKNGYLFIASCSHNANLQDLTKASATGISKAGRTAKIIRTAGASFDHPIHPFLPESEYLKSITYQLN